MILTHLSTADRLLQISNELHVLALRDRRELPLGVRNSLDAAIAAIDAARQSLDDATLCSPTIDSPIACAGTDAYMRGFEAGKLFAVSQPEDSEPWSNFVDFRIRSRRDGLTNDSLRKMAAAITENETISTEDALNWLLQFSLALPNAADVASVQFFIDAWYWGGLGQREQNRQAAAAQFRKRAAANSRLPH